MMVNYSVVSCSLEEHGEQILAIFNDAIENSTALYEYKPRTMANMESWFGAKAEGKFPVIGLVSDDGLLMGFGSFGAFRVQPAYKYTAEHSVYVHSDFRGQGLGKVLLKLVIESAEERGLHALIGVIDSKNSGSIALHENLGFKLVGQLPQVGFKFDRWLDVSLYQLTLAGPTNPIDG
jgi:phosphinothricin acetyltransferase